MAYFTRDQYIERFGSNELNEVLSSETGTTLEAAIADAESIVNGYLAAVPRRAYVVPLAGAIPVRVTEITADLARYEVHAKQVTFEIKRRRAQAIKFLEDLVKGLVAIPELLPPDPLPVNQGGIAIVTEERVFTACTLSGYVGR